MHDKKPTIFIVLDEWEHREETLDSAIAETLALF